MLPGTTVVVSPLIALMKDQLDMLAERGVHETCRAQLDLERRSGSRRDRAHRRRAR